MTPSYPNGAISSRKSGLLLCAAAAFLPSAFSQFQFEIPQDFFGGGGFQQAPRQQQQRGRRGVQHRVPRGIDEKFAWMKGTEWMWNKWREVRFEYDVWIKRINE
jgi:hypothetical protein